MARRALDLVFVALGRFVRLLAGVPYPDRSSSEIIAERARLAQLLAWADWRAVGVMLSGHALTAATPAALALVVGWLVDSVMDGPRALVEVAQPLVAFGVVLAAQQLGNLVSRTAGSVVAQQIDRRARRRLRELASAPAGIGHLEEPGFQDDAIRVTDLGLGARVRSPGTASVGQVVLVFRLVAAVLAAGVVANFSTLLAVGLLLLSLLGRAILRIQWMSLTALNDEMTPIQRRTSYWTDLIVGESAAKEIRLFGLGGWVTDRRTANELSWLTTLLSRKDRIYGRQVWTATMAACSSGAALLVPGLAAANGDLGLDGLAACLTAAWGVFSISAMGHEAFDIEYGIGAVHALDRLTAAEHPSDELPDTWAPVPTAARPPVIEFDGVGFGYQDDPVLGGLDLRIGSGEVVAVVGVNGAGKSTMMKLLGGLYQPTTGRITIDGLDLSTLDLDQWRQRLTVLFQDFLRYPLSCAENIQAGAADRPLDAADLADALRLADADDLVAHLPLGVDTPLTRLRTGGVDLSGGQWQRLALARVLYAVRQGRDVVVLDEPTAHLDVRAEAEFYERVVAAVAGATVLLISHRLSTVRHADRIVLLDGGRIAEAGSHDQLMAAGGVYARLFGLQAARFSDDITVATVSTTGSLATEGKRA